MSTLLIQPKHVFTQWNLRANWGNNLKKYPPRLLNRSSRTAVGKDQRVNQVRLANYANELSSKWLELLRKPSCQKLVCEKSNFCKIQGMPHVDTVDTCMQWDNVTGPPGALLFDRDQRLHWKNHFNCCFVRVATLGIYCTDFLPQMLIQVKYPMPSVGHHIWWKLNTYVTVLKQ